MRIQIESVLAVRSGTEVLLSLLFEGASPRTHTYRVSMDDYTAAGSPDMGDGLPDELLPSILEEDARLAYARAVKILSSGDNTKRALLRKLCERGFLRESAEEAVARLEKDGYIREEELLLRQLGVYAKRLWGPKRFIPNLLEKGFCRADIERALVRAKSEGIYDPDAVKESLLSALATDDPAQRRAWLYKHGF